MKVLIIGGTGLISVGIIKHLLARGADVTMLNRGQRGGDFGGRVKTIVQDRNQFEAFERIATQQNYDVVIDMICFNPEQAQSDIRAFSKRCGHFIFCSTVCAYGVKVPPNVLVDETFPREPISGYGKNKMACEDLFIAAHQRGELNTTIIRPSCTYGPGGTVIDNLEFNPVAWDRIERSLPILCSGDGLGLWVATHRDDCGKLFAYGAMNPKTFGQSYNATRDENFSWRDLLSQAARALGKQANVLFMPAEWIVKHDPKRFGLLAEITKYHGAYTSAKAKRDVPEFRCEIGYGQGVSETFADIRKRNAWRNSADDSVYETMVSTALAAGVEPVLLG